MALALQLAERGLYSAHPNPRVGCVVVSEGDIVGCGWHRRAGEAHAEVNALAEAGARARGASVYVTLEPCSHHGRTPPCAQALVDAGVARVVVATGDPNPAVAGQGLALLEAAGIETLSGVLEEPARALNAGFLRRMAGGAPWVRLKVAASLDGRTAMASGESQWITGPDARSDVQRLRARSGAIITGSGTVLDDDPSLTVRPEELGELGDKTLPPQQPLRVVLDPRLLTAPDARVVTGEGQCLVVSTAAALEESRARPLRDGGAEVVTVDPDGSGRPALAAVLGLLAARGINDVLIEAGATLAGAALEADVIDEFWLYLAPTMLGSRAKPMAELALDRMAQQHRMEVWDRRVVGADQRLILKPAVSGH
ncbi:bifunctional diaminohydroxyphosphoribosylaminopyrimidine deaminase/5-amino-6-(5-phosphoribosylamino)uracil reductase RibD [Halospina sp. K52047b]|nr:bifunctional diaminohydroxyphosphoribosylaminopyrimidine deaminase/5-amino-6-(5-phosphoribosylamino)uracil reductase RibD [Halospina sp. K52047b]KAA8982615.1 bifunctional diaminohydroxyphosphoribosylaminopyrimidine deaminase/5-amino-6-(5-phosphoribosylamino)uracil reductase RibD [Halospina sp. K52047b]